MTRIYSLPTTTLQKSIRNIALILMIINHSAKIAFMQHPHIIYFLHYFGLAAYPLLALLITYNLIVRGVPYHKYLVRLLLFGILAQYYYMDVFGVKLNALFELAIGVVVVTLLQRPFSLLNAAAIALLLILEYTIGSNGGHSVLMFILFSIYFSKESPISKEIAIGLLLLVLFNRDVLYDGIGLSVLITVMGIYLLNQSTTNRQHHQKKERVSHSNTPMGLLQHYAFYIIYVVQFPVMYYSYHLFFKTS